MNIPEALQYTDDHEWVSLEGDVATIGITDYAQGELGDVVFVELPEVGAQFNVKDSIGELEAVKTVADVFIPVAGEVVEVNQQLVDAPELLNKDPYGDGWIAKIKISDTSVVETLLTAEQYQSNLA